MTTIATDGVSIAGDGLIHSDGQMILKDQKKISVGSGVVYAISGVCCLFDAAIKWIEAGADPEKVPKTPDGQWQVIVIKPGSFVAYTDTCPYPEPQKFPYAMGSGRAYALSALKLGRSPRQAVEFAMECNLYTGGEIQVAQFPWMPDIAVRNGALEYQAPYDQPRALPL